MPVHNISARAYKTAAKLKVRVEILESSSKKDNYSYNNIYKSILDLIYQHLKSLDSQKWTINIIRTSTENWNKKKPNSR
jgi:hypothetical protein